MSMPSTTANWHWKNKNVTQWAKTWFQEELTKISIQGDGGETIKVTSTSWLDGDVELGQRKSKLITIYDCKISLEWTGTASDGTEITSKVTIPEVSHEITLDHLSDYTYQWSESGSASPAVTALYTLVKERLPIVLEAKFAELPVAIIEKHGKDLTVSGEPSRTATPAPPPVPSTNDPLAPPVPAAAKSVAVTKSVLNTSRIVKEATFMAAADDLFGLLTDQQRIPSWTRAPAESAARADTPYSLFGGGVKGKYLSLTPGKEIVQTWALSSPTWPSEHEATLTITFEQLSDSTKVMFTLAGVPTGMEDELERNIDGYYIHGLKSIGYVQLIVSPTYTRPRRMAKNSRPSIREKKGHVAGNRTATAVAIVVVVLAAVLCLPYCSHSVISSRSFAK